MKTILTCVILLLCLQPASSQELATRDGLTLSYEASKTETTKKADKWNIKVTINNTTGADLYFASSAAKTSIALDASYARIDIPNAKGLLTLNLKFFRAKLVEGVVAPDNHAVFKIPAGTIVEDFNTAVAIGETPQVKGSILMDLKSYADVTGQAAPATTSVSAPSAAAAPTPAATPAAATATVSDNTSITVIERAGLTPGQKLLINQSLEMPASPEIRLILDGSGNLSLYNDGGKAPLWSTNTGGKHVAYAEMQTDGNFVLKTAGGDAVWSTNTGGHAGSMIVLGQGGILMIMSKELQSIWLVP